MYICTNLVEKGNYVQEKVVLGLPNRVSDVFPQSSQIPKPSHTISQAEKQWRWYQHPIFLHNLFRSESGANGTDLDVAVDDLGVGALSLDVGGNTGGGGASTSSNTRGAGVLGGRIVGVEPEHVDRMVVPDGEGENHATTEGAAHGRHTSELGEVVVVAESGLLFGTELVGDAVGLGHAADLGDAVVDDDAVLDVLAADLGELAGVGAVSGDELGDDCHLALGVDLHTRAVESLVAHAVRIEVATIRIAYTGIAL